MVALIAALLAFAAYNALKPAETELDQVQMLGSMIIDEDWDDSTPEQRQQFRQQWDTLSPQAQQEVFNMVARHRIQQLRQQFAGLTQEERSAKIQKTLQQMRKQRESLPDDEREQLRERLNSEEGQRMVKAAMELYLTEFTAKERAEMDPLMHEWLFQIQELAQ